MSNFAFLTTEWKEIHDTASKAESMAIPVPHTSCSHAANLELAGWRACLDGRTAGKVVKTSVEISFFALFKRTTNLPFTSSSTYS